jgi:hypothetical protein
MTPVPPAYSRAGNYAWGQFKGAWGRYLDRMEAATAPIRALGARHYSHNPTLNPLARSLVDSVFNGEKAPVSLPLPPRSLEHLETANAPF